MIQPPAGHANDTERLVEVCRALGATDEEIAGKDWGELGPLAAELALRGPDAVAAADGLADPHVSQLWRAFGLPFDGPAPRVALSRVLADKALWDGAVELFGDEAVLALARVVGTVSARLAEAVVDAFRIEFEVPELAQGTSYADVVARYLDLIGQALPAFEHTTMAVFRGHLVRVAAGTWMPADDGSATRRDLAVGFVDMAGYTALSRTLSPRELTVLLSRFEAGVLDSLADHAARLVKQVGDGAMFVADSVADGAAAALALADCFAASDVVPPVRVGLAAGSVISQYGDYYGDVVNLAARLVALAMPGTVVVSDAVAAALRDGWALERLPDQALKGFGTPAVVHRLLPR